MATMPKSIIRKGFWEELLPALELTTATVQEGCSVQIENQNGVSVTTVNLTVIADAALVAELIDKYINNIEDYA